MHCNLRPSDIGPSDLACNYEAYMKFEVDQAICSWLITFLLLIRYATLIFDLFILKVTL